MLGTYTETVSLLNDVNRERQTDTQRGKYITPGMPDSTIIIDDSYSSLVLNRKLYSMY